MIHPIKLVWGIRAVIYSIFFKKIGKFTYIGKPCFLEGIKRIKIGNKTRVFPGVRIQAIENGDIEIGNNVAIEQNCHITSAGSCLVIEDNVTIAANAFITNVDHEYKDISKSVLEQGLIYKETKVGEGSFIGYGAAIQAGTILGKHCVVGTNAVVRGVFPDYSVIVGCPARVIKRFNIESQEWERC